MHPRGWLRQNTRHMLIVCGLAVSAGVAATAAPLGQAPTPSPSAPCIALMMPEVKGVPGQSADVANGVRQLFASYLTAPTFNAVILDAKLPVVALDEARQKGCQNVLSVTLTGKQAGGSRLTKIAGQAAGTAAAHVPGTSGTGSSIVRGAVVGGGQAVSALASTTKVKDELKLEFRVQTLEKKVKVGPATQQARAEVNGEDILTPVVQRAASQIAEALLKP